MTKCRDFKAFHFEQAVAFKRRLEDQVNPKTGRKLSKATLNGALAYLKRFFHCLAGQPGYKSRLQYSDADYFNLSEKNVRIATARRAAVGPTLDQVKHVISLMPTDTLIQRTGSCTDCIHYSDGCQGQCDCVDEVEAR